MADLNSPKKNVSKRSLGNKKLQSQTAKSNMNKPSTSAEETQVSHNDSPASRSYQIEKFEIGDIVWAKIGKYPFWPSIVCKDPVTKTHIKGSPNEKRKLSLHVRFCNDNGRRSWAKILESYEGKANLLSKYPNSLVPMKNSKKQMEMWNLAVKEADNWLKFDKEERWDKFSNQNKIASPSNSPCKYPNQSLSASISNNSLSGTTTIKKNTDGSTQNDSNCFVYLKNISVKPREGVKKKKLAVKKKTKNRKAKKIPDDMSFRKPCPENSYHIDEKILSTTERMNVHERTRRNIEILEAEGIRKIREWKAQKTAKTARIASRITNGKKKN